MNAMSKEKFKARFESGKVWEKLVHQELVEAGIPAEMTQDGWVDGLDVYDCTVNDKDIIIPVEDGEPIVLEVKSRTGRTKFSGPGDFPWKDIIVDTKYGTDRKAVQPDYYVNICQATAGIIVLDGKDKKHWTTKKIWDGFERQENNCYMCPVDLFHDWEWLLRVLRVQLTGQEDDTSAPV